MNRKTFAYIFLFFIIVSPVAFADKGMISYDPSAKLFEPNQRALIAWNGEEEILLLTTDIKASKPTTVLEVLPLPSEPKVTKGDLKTFDRAMRIMNMKLSKGIGIGSKGKSSNDSQSPAGRITFHEQIGPHNVTVVEVLSGAGFVKWVEKTLTEQGAANVKVPAWMTEEIEEYIKGGFTWFVFDSVKIGPDLKTVEPLRYRFKTKHLFFPLRITRVEEQSQVVMLVITERLLKDFPALSNHRVSILNKAVKLDGRELKRIDLEMSELFKDSDSVMLRNWTILGKDGTFDKDLIAY